MRQFEALNITELCSSALEKNVIWLAFKILFLRLTK